MCHSSRGDDAALPQDSHLADEVNHQRRHHRRDDRRILAGQSVGTDPFGIAVRYSCDTMDRWIRRYRAGGFEELMPSPRTCSPRTDTATWGLATSVMQRGR